MRVQCLLIAAVISLKRLATVLRRLFGAKRYFYAMIETITRLLSIIRQHQIIRRSVSAK